MDGFQVRCSVSMEALDITRHLQCCAVVFLKYKASIPNIPVRLFFLKKLINSEPLEIVMTFSLMDFAQQITC